VFGGYSLSTFARAEADLTLPTFAKNRAKLTLMGRYIDAPDVRYFGVGDSSQKANETRFGYTPSTGGARLDVEISKSFSVGAGVEYTHVKTSDGKTAPSIETRFSPVDTPGLELAKYDYIKSSARAAFDWRRAPGYTGSGGLYRVQFDDVRDRDYDPYSYKSVEAEAIQLIPILRANWVIALRGLATITDFDDGGAVPFFLLPSLGGGTTLRGYPDFRFQDRNRLLMNAELRWTPARFLDMAIFYDTGKVTARRQDLDFEDLKESYGIGMRLIGASGYMVRIEAAHSREHNVRLIVAAGGGF
jgi:outer membrane protein assembly factor BamA